jgi:Peptidase_G2, IMC autoproteolytic cleavage domain
MTIRLTLLTALLVSLGLSYSFAQNVGIGTSTPVEKLHVAGSLRVDNLATTNNATATSRVLYVDALGKIYSFPTGSPGMVLGLNPSGVLTWINPGTSNTLNSGQIWIGNGANTPQAQTLSGDVIVNNTGVTTIQDGAVDGSDIALSGQINGSIMYFNGTEWVNLGPGSADQVLVINGSGIPQWSNANTILTKKDVVAGTGNNAISISNGTAQVVGASNVTVNVATNGLNQAGVVTGTTAGNVQQVWGTTAAGVPGWTSPNALVKVQNGLNINTLAPNASAANPYIELGGTLLRNTTITQDNFNYLQSLSGTGVYEVRGGATAGAGLYVNTANSVGIGTASPSASAQLQVNSSTKGVLIPNLALTATNIAAPVTAPATSLLVYNTATAGVSPNNVTPGYYYWNSTAWQRFDTGNNTGDWKLDGNSNGVLRSIGTNDNFDFPIETNGTEKMRVMAGGNVGIGTAAPSTRFHVYGTTTNAMTVQSTSTESDINYIVPTGNWQVGTNNAGNGTSSNQFYIYDNAYRLTVQNGTGNVGVGTTTPDDKLDVMGNAQVSGYLRAGNANAGSQLKKGVKTFARGADATVNGTTTGGALYNPVGPYGYTQVPMGQLDLPPGATNVVVTGVAYNITGLREDNDENVSLLVRIGGNETGWSSGSSFTLFGGGDVWFDWNWVADVNWSYTSNQTVQLMFYEEYENCWLCNNNPFYFTNIEVNIFYEYTTSLQAGDISAAGRVYSNSQYDVGDLAEHFEVEGDRHEAGMIVSLKKGADNAYELTSEPYDELMVGVISENPSVVLNNPNIGPAVALTGRVKVKIAPGESLVKSGDFLTSSHIPGRAVIAKQAGPVIGYAVKNQQANEDFVEILVQPGRFYYPRQKPGEGRKPVSTMQGQPANKE